VSDGENVMTRGAFKAATLPRQPVDATHTAQAAGSVPPIYTKGGCLTYFLGGVGAGSSAGDECLEGLRGNSPALAGRLWGGEAFGVPQRGTAYQPGVKPRVWRTTGAF